MQKEYGPKGLVLVALSDEKKSTVAPFVKKNKMNYIVGADAGKTRAAFGVRGYPTIIVADPDGKIVWQGHSGEEAEQFVEKTLKEKPPKNSGSLAEATAEADYKKARDLLKKGEYARALDAFDAVAKKHKDTKFGPKAAARAAKIRGDKEIMARLRDAEAARKCENWLTMARGLARSDRRDGARKYYRKILDEFPDTKYADIARQELAALSP